MEGILTSLFAKPDICQALQGHFYDGANFRYFTQVGANLKKILMFGQKLGMQTQFLVKNCMILKYFAQLGGCVRTPALPLRRGLNHCQKPC